MIGYLSGRVMEVNPDSILLFTGADGDRAGGVGYEVLTHLRLLTSVECGDNLGLWIHTHVREDAFQLFGFETSHEKNFFLNLLKVNGVGPKLAINVLSGGNLQQISQLIESEDVKGLSRIPKLGKKTAEQMILTLKGKLVSQDKTQESFAGGAKRDIRSALVNLGFKANDVDRVVDKLPSSVEVEEGIKISLSQLATV